MSKFLCLFSSSKGNCYYFQHGETGILIDAGRSCKQIFECLEKNSISPDSIKAVFITHEHSDHTSAVSTLCKKISPTVYATFGTISELQRVNIIKPETEFAALDSEGVTVGDITVKPFCTSHDCADSCGYTLQTPDGFKLGICTDLGYVSPTVKNAVTGCNAIAIEFNHDIDMLKTGPYPPPLKSRILSTCGHLNNEDAAELCAHLVQNGTTRFYLSHISQENNLPEKAMGALRVSLKRLGLEQGVDYEAIPFAPGDNDLIYF